MQRTHLYLSLVVAAFVCTAVLWGWTSAAPKPPVAVPPTIEPKPEKHLPLGQVVLFNSGVGYFQREGTIEDDTRLDLQFPATDVNDLLKSLVLQDQGHGKITAISYDSQEPIDRTLKSFSLDLTYNPTLGQLLNQARGEKVEVVMQTGAGTAPGTLTGAVIGMESQADATQHETHLLNLLCTDGVRCCNLKDVQRVRFLNPTLDAEFHRALELLAGAHNGLKKNVSFQFAGQGKRAVKIGYVVEAPLWKTSYRLVFDKDGKPTIQGWAIVENTTDEDWKDVRMALVSSRPISFQMDLYQPLFVPRPVVEPEQFASLRPPVHEGALAEGLVKPGAGLAGVGGIGGVAGIGGFGGGGFQGGFGGVGFQGGFQGNFQGASNLGVGGGGLGQFGQFGIQGGQFGLQGGGLNRYQGGPPSGSALPTNRLTYEQLQERRKEREEAKEQAKKVGAAIAQFDPTESIDPAALAETVGDQVQYIIDHKVSLARQRSALLPLVNQEVAGERVSIYNEKVHAKFPLRGLKFKNTTNQSLMQGPVTIYEGGTYAGDARLPDLQPNEDRLLSFAIDQAVEVKSEARNAPDELTAVRIVKGVMDEVHRLRQTTRYLIKNRSTRARTLIVEHPIHTDWKLAGEEKAVERSRDFYRFTWKEAAGESIAHDVVEEQSRAVRVVLGNISEQKVGLLLRSNVVSPKLKEALQQAATLTRRLAEVRSERADVEAQLKAITDDQARLRANLDKLPASSASHKRTVEKFDKQETQIEKLQAQIEALQAKEKLQQKELEQFVASLTVE
jgi:hypothetical protein